MYRGKLKWVHLNRPNGPYSGRCPVPAPKADNLVARKRARFLSPEEAAKTCVENGSRESMEDALEHVTNEEMFQWGNAQPAPATSGNHIGESAAGQILGAGGEAVEKDIEKGPEEPEEVDEDVEEDVEPDAEPDDELERLRELAKEAGVERYWQKGLEKLKAGLEEAGVSF